MHYDADIVIAGAGPAGLAAACALGAEGHRVIVADPVAPAVEADPPEADLRTTAILQPSRDLLERAGAWGDLAGAATPLRVMRIVDAAGDATVARDFASADVSEAPFGWNVANRALRRALCERAAGLPDVELRLGVGVAGLLLREAGARVTLSDGARISAPLVIACDGRDSPVRAMAGIGAKRTEFGQAAIVFAVAHPAPHDGVSIEVHRAGGPFTLVPLPDRDGAHRSAVVWMDAAAEQARRMALDDAGFEAEVQARSAGVAGRLSVVSARALWPISTVRAERLTARRLALAAEAAHAMPPIGAQGFNTSMADVAVLRDLAARLPLGGTAMLDAYEGARARDVALRSFGVGLLNRASIAGAAPVQALRGLGIRALHDVAPLRRAVMRAGLGRRS